jgi:peptidoglycan hydrolase CwlO-like protein
MPKTPSGESNNMQTDNARAIARGKRIYRTQQERKRGFAVSHKLLAIAILVEGTVIAASFFAAVVFADKYASDPEATEVAGLAWVLPLAHHGSMWWLMVAAGVVAGVAELVRLPLVHAFRTHSSMWMRTGALLGVLLCCTLTVKVVSVVTEQAYAQRLHEVNAADEALTEARGKLDKLAAEREAANSAVTPLTESLQRLDAQIEATNKTIQGTGAPPPDRKVVKSVPSTCWDVNRKKSYRCTKTVTSYVPVEWQGRALVDQLAERNAERDRLTAERADKAKAVAAVDVAIAEARNDVVAAESRRRGAVDRSQIHSFAGMFLGKSPNDVSDAETFWFLRVFVLTPSVMVALASSLLAMSAYRNFPRPKDVQPIIVQLPQSLNEVAIVGAETR